MENKYWRRSWGFIPEAIVLGLLLLSGGESVLASEKIASFNSMVAPGTWSGTRLKDLPERARVEVELITDGELYMSLVREEKGAGLTVGGNPIFRGKTADSLNFALNIPRTGNYILVFDNRAGNSERVYSVTVKASAPLTQAVRQLKAFAGLLQKAFIVDALAVEVVRCGTNYASSDPGVVRLCAEDTKRLASILPARRLVGDAVIVFFLQGVSQVLLDRWHDPLGHQDTRVQELATVLATMFGQEERFRRIWHHIDAAEYIEPIDNGSPMTRRLLSPANARRVLSWMDQPDLARRWQSRLIPHMQTAFLEVLMKKEADWLDHALMRRELSERGRAAPSRSHEPARQQPTGYTAGSRKTPRKDADKQAPRRAG